MFPAYFANMAPEPLGKIFLKKWDTPIDFNKKLKKKQILGPHKTYRGILFAIIVSLIVAFIQSRINSSLNLYDYSNWILFGFLMGVGAMAGDAVKSFFKRRFNIKSGKPWIFDNIDFVIGALIFASFVYFPGWKNVIAIVIMSFPLTMIVKYIAFKLNLRREIM